MSELQVYTTKYLFAKTKSILAELKALNPHWKKAFDAPAGSGALSRFMVEDLKLEVEATEIDQSKWKYPGAKFQVLDLNNVLPYENESFDLVVCLEGIKHLSHPQGALGEFNRILKPKGTLVLTIPNDLCMQSRLRYLFDGYVDVDWIKPMDPSDENEANHMNLNSLISLPYLYYWMKKCGFKYERSTHDRFRGWSVLFAILFWPFIKISQASKGGNQVLNCEMSSMTWLCGRRNIIVATKN